MKFITLSFDGNEPRERVLPVLQAVAAIFGLVVTRPGGAVIADAVAAHDRAREVLTVRIDASPVKEVIDEACALIKAAQAGDDLPPQDDPAAILAAAQGGGAPLDDPAAVLSGAGAGTSTSAPAEPPATSIELDASGLPWDERIHASSRAKVQNGTWRKRSKLAEGVYERIEAELRIHFPKPAAALPPPPPAGGAGGGSEFAALVQRLHAGYARENDPVTKEQQVQAMQHFGISGLEELSKRPDLFEAFAGMLGI